MPNPQHTAFLKESLERQNIEVIHVFSTNKYGPFNYLNEIDPLNEEEHQKFIQNFKWGIYAIAKPKKKSIEIIQLDDETPITIYRPFRFLIGEAFSHDEKKSFLIYVPKPYLNEIKKIQIEDKQNRLKELNDASKKHYEFFENFFNRLQEESQKVLDNFFRTTNLKELAMKGNRKDNVPNQIIEAIRRNKIPTHQELPLGEFIAHEESIELPNGQIKTLVLIIITNFKGSSTQEYQANNCHISETTENYSILYNLLSK